MKRLTCAITGHRFSSLPFQTNELDPRCIALKDALRTEFIDLIEKQNVQLFLCGMALGSDQIAAELLIQLKNVYPSIQLHAYIPCREQYQKWTPPQNARYRAILTHCDEIIHTAERYSIGCMQKRNRAMVDHADFVLAVYIPPKSGGTKNTLEYAKKKNRTIIQINPQKV